MGPLLSQALVLHSQSGEPPTFFNNYLVPLLRVDPNRIAYSVTEK